MRCVADEPLEGLRGGGAAGAGTVGAGVGVGAGAGAGAGVGVGPAGPSGAVAPRAGPVPKDAPSEVFAAELVFEVARVLEESESAVDRNARWVTTRACAAATCSGGCVWLSLGVHRACVLHLLSHPRPPLSPPLLHQLGWLCSLAALGMDSLKMHSLTGALQHRFGITLSQEQMFGPTTSVAWITANRAPLYQQRALEDGTVQPPTLPFVEGATQCLYGRGLRATPLSYQTRVVCVL
jgi:hypothetical protein